MRHDPWMNGSLFCLLGLAAVGCTGTWRRDPISAEEARESCGYSKLDATGYPLSGWDGAPGVSEVCARILGRAVGLDWASFGEEPHAFDAPETSAETVIGGVAVLVAYGNTLEVAESPPLEARLDEVQAGLGDERGARPEEVWLGLVQRWVEGVVYEPTETRAMSRSAEDGVVSVASPEILGTNPVSAALALVHEAAHGFSPNHEPCSPGSEHTCDADPTGAYGAGVLWAYNWLTNNQASLAPVTCINAESALVNQCGHIYGADGFTPCADDQGYCL